MLAIRLEKLLKEQEEQIKTRDEALEKAREEIKWLRGMLKEQEAAVRCEDCEYAGAAYFTDEGEMLYDCNKTECCKQRSVK